MFRRDAPGVSGEIADIFINLLSLVANTDIDPNRVVQEKVDRLLLRHSLTPVGSSRGQEGKCSKCRMDLEPGWEWCPTCGSSRHLPETGLSIHRSQLAHIEQGVDVTDDIQRWDLVAKHIWTSRPSSQKWVSANILMPAIENALGGPVDELLDVGCGDASMSATIANKYGSRLLAYDPSAEMLKLAERTVGHDRVVPNIDLIESNSILAAMANMVLSTVIEPRSLLLDVRRVLVPGARFVVTLPHPCFTLLREMHRTTDRAWSEPPVVGPEFIFAGPLATYFRSAHENVLWDSSHLNEELTTRIYNRTLSQYFDMFAECGFSVRNMFEPTPVDRGAHDNPELFQLYSTLPGFICVQLEKDPYFRGLN